ncbi:hypothetical protein GCM10008941_35250 [Rhizomicrobium palustre]
MFVWMSIAHMATPLGTMGFSEIPNEKPVLAAMKTSIKVKDGLYMFPWVDPKDPQMMEKGLELTKTNPEGILLYHAPGSATAMGPMLLHEFLKELAQSFLGVFLLSLTALTGYFARAGFVGLIGVFAAFGQDTSYFIWYGFPLSYTLAQITIGVVGALVAGLAIAAIAKPKPA